MGTRILSGLKINECDRSGACFYDSTTGMAFGPVFESEEDAESFLSYLSEQDPRDSRWWDHPTSKGFRLYKAWIGCGKLPHPPVYQFDDGWLEQNDPDLGGAELSFSCNMSDTCFPLFSRGNNEACKELVRAGVIATEKADSEYSCLYQDFDTQKEGLAFLQRLNVYLQDNWPTWSHEDT